MPPKQKYLDSWECILENKNCVCNGKLEWYHTMQVIFLISGGGLGGPLLIKNNFFFNKVSQILICEAYLIKNMGFF